MSSSNVKAEEVIVDNVEYNSTEELEEELQLQLEDSGGESYKIEYQTDNQITGSSQQQQKLQQQDGMRCSTSHQRYSPGGGIICKTSGYSGTTVVVEDENGGEATIQTTPVGGKMTLESEKRMRREIANSNERRRMQSINAGFQNLRSLLPRHEGEKLSKAAILQQTSQYICELEDQKNQLLAQNNQLKRQLGQQEIIAGGCEEGSSETVVTTINWVAVKKRKLPDNVVSIQTISDSSDEGLGSMSPEPMTLLNAAGGNSTTSIVTNTKGQLLLSQNNAKELVELKEQLFKERRLRTMLEDELQTIKRQLYSVATAPQPTAIGDVTDGSGGAYMPREVIEHTGNYIRDDCEEFSYVEIDELTGQQQVVVCSSIEELDHETAAAAADIITEDNVHEEVMLSSSPPTETEQEVAVNAIAKVYAEGSSPSPAILQPILQAAIKGTPKVEMMERITDSPMKKVKTEKIEQTSGLTRSRQNLETIVEAIRHLEGDHLFTESPEQHKVLVTQTTQQQGGGGGTTIVRGQEAPLALTTKHHVAQRKTLAELRPFLQIKGNKHVTIVGGGGTSVTLTKAGTVMQTHKDKHHLVTGGSTNVAGTTTAILPATVYKVHSANSGSTNNVVMGGSGSVGVVGSSAGIGHGNVTITAASTTTGGLKQCRPGVIVAKQLS